MSKFRLSKVEKELLVEPYRQFVNLRDPIQFIDLLCAGHYFAGQFGNNIPVNQARDAFAVWLSHHDKELLATPTTKEETE